MESWQGKQFSITDPKDVKTVIYQVNKTDKEVTQGPPYTVERLRTTEELRGDNSRKTFYVDNPLKDGNSLVILSFGKEKVIVNTGLLVDDKVLIRKKPMPIKFETLYSEKDEVYKEFNYTPNLKRPISIIDPETTEEIKPVLYFDEVTNEVKGKCKIKPGKTYFVFEIKID
ncbi:MAG: hypothetical protein IJV31_07470 [Clostridia bacterium]|nr:hypothetical protein [Clostridia bacterium]